jgi:predicted nuclease of predicted toxin-antitoxin system
MKILLDENLPHKLRFALQEEGEVYTTHYMGWSGLSDAQLLQAMEKASFELLITADNNLPHQQNLSNYSFTVLVLLLHTSRWQEIEKRVEEIQIRIQELASKEVKVSLLFHVIFTKKGKHDSTSTAPTHKPARGTLESLCAAAPRRKFTGHSAYDSGLLAARSPKPCG